MPRNERVPEPCEDRKCFEGRFRRSERPRNQECQRCKLKRLTVARRSATGAKGGKAILHRGVALSAAPAREALFAARGGRMRRGRVRPRNAAKTSNPQTSQAACPFRVQQRTSCVHEVSLVNAGDKLRRRAGVKIHQAARPEGHRRDGFRRLAIRLGVSRPAECRRGWLAIDACSV
jgi:hypothetical protein